MEIRIDTPQFRSAEDYRAILTDVEAKLSKYGGLNLILEMQDIDFGVIKSLFRFIKELKNLPSSDQYLHVAFDVMNDDPELREIAADLQALADISNRFRPGQLAVA